MANKKETAVPNGPFFSRRCEAAPVPADRGPGPASVETGLGNGRHWEIIVLKCHQCIMAGKAFFTDFPEGAVTRGD